MKIFQIEPVYTAYYCIGIDLRATLVSLSKTVESPADTCLLIKGRSLSDSLWLARGIRLSLSFTRRLALCPIVILPVATESHDDFLRRDCDGTEKTEIENLAPGLQAFIHTPQIYLASTDKEAETYIKKASALKAEDFECFMDMIKVTSQQGSHAIANEWAAYTLGRLLGIRSTDEIPATRDLTYLCYLLLSGMSKEDRAKLCADEGPASKESCSEIQLANSSGNNILLIDDQDEVWTPVVQKLLGGNNSLTVWGKDIIKRVNDEIYLNGMCPQKWTQNIIGNFDLVILDMRLFGETISTPDNELSGLQVLKTIMDFNRGQRVIMFTSSNKVWNIKRSLELGAADIFIKESPQFPMNEKNRADALQDLVSNISEALSHSWLKDVYGMGAKLISDAKKYAEVKDSSVEKRRLYLDIADQTAGAIDIFMNARNDPKKIKLAYFQLYNIFELCIQYYKTVTEKDKVQLDDLKELFDLKYTDYIFQSFTPLRLMRNRIAHSNQQDKKVFYIRSYGNYYERQPWILGEKNKTKQLVEKISDASDPNAFRALMYTASHLVAKPICNLD